KKKVIGAYLNSLLLFIRLRKPGIYHPSPCWRPFFMHLIGATLVLARDEAQFTLRVEAHGA
ncbi:hypothetical protein, partial [Burkholderia sp. Ac-20392]|uniref:hypothetical protein n=1 Tax=Burkholderia sp. Ac-20392 TaxID=2703905 RepID=UPI00197CBE55